MNTKHSMTSFSICIPRIDKSINRYKIFETFRKLFIGRILRIDIITNKRTNNRRAFIHYKYTYDTRESNHILSILNEGGYINVVYDFPEYWKCYKNNVKYQEKEKEKE